MKTTYVDADVLIAAAKGTEELSVPALDVLGDPGRSFVCSVYLKLEVLPVAAFFDRTEVVAFYREFFDAVTHWVSSSPELSKRALDLASRYGLGAMDALHVAAAEVADAQLVTAEKPTKPLLRIGSHRVTSIRGQAENEKPEENS